MCDQKNVAGCGYVIGYNVMCMYSTYKPIATMHTYSVLSGLFLGGAAPP